MNVRDCSTLRLCINVSNGTSLLLLLCISQSDLQQRQNSYLKMNVKHILTYMYAEQQGILSRRLLKMTWNVFTFFIQLHLQTMIVFYINFPSEKNNNPKMQLQYTRGNALHAVFTLKFLISKSLIFYFFCFCF